MKCAWHLFSSANNRRISVQVLIALFLTLATVRAHGETANVYKSGGEWRDEMGRPFHLASLAGKKTVFALFYASCKTICPMTLNSLKQIEKAAGLGSDLQIVLVTIDPKADTPEHLAQYLKNHNLKGWKALTGKLEDVKSLAVTLGLGFEEKRGTVELHQMHSKTMVVVRETGAVAGALPLIDFELSQAKSLIASK